MGGPGRSLARAALVVLACAVFVPGCVRVASDGPNGVEPTEATGQNAEVPPQMGGVSEGTEGDDVLRTGRGSQILRGLGGDDEIHGGEDRDRLYGGAGDDVIDAQDPRSVGKAGRDEISCGPGRDEVLMDADDGEKPRDCEMATVGSS